MRHDKKSHAIGYSDRHTQGSLLPEVLSKYLSEVFVETGTNLGTGTQTALDVGFPQIYTIERDVRFAQEAAARFAGVPQVTVMNLESPIGLLKVIPTLVKRATVYLDAHGPNSTPILEELAALCCGARRDHTILIDDVRMFGTVEWGHVNEKQVLEALARVNSRYVLSYEPTPNGASDLLVAQL